MEYKEEKTPPTIIPIEVPIPKGFIKVTMANPVGNRVCIAISRIYYYGQRYDGGTDSWIELGDGSSNDATTLDVQETIDQISAQIIKQQL